jgi:2-succinyl-5-enolpyruvyl-6-hydroxy-3-cyclohexene-1-carboxylate synthase
MPGSDANLNALWCRCIVEELVRGGVRHAVLCPGSRNSPLLFACSALAQALAGQAVAPADAISEEAGGTPELTLVSHVDERGAGFVALGLAKSTLRPTVVCVTSGSALANLLPAVVEAHAAGIPLVVLAADRPWEVQEVGAPQTMRQRGIFAPFLAREVDLGEPQAEELVLRSLRAQVSRAVQLGLGPVMINVPLREPLPPLPDPRWVVPELSSTARHGRGQGAAYTCQVRATALHAHLAQTPQTSQEALGFLRPGLRGIITVGAASSGDAALIRDFAVATGYPLIADSPSGLRCGGLQVITAADALLTGELTRLEPELVIQIGSAPLARPVYEYLYRQNCPWLAIESAGSRDVQARAWAVITAADAGVYAELARRCGSGDVAWRERWLAAEDLAVARLRAHLQPEPWGEVLAAHVSCTAEGFRFLHLASSMAVRHGNLHCRAEQSRPVHANRGLNGIDGTIASFLGENLGLGGGGLLLCGDLAFLHDSSSLALVASAPERLRARLHGAIVVINNGGGGIFDFLAVAQVPDWQDLVRTPQRQDISAAAAQFHCPYQRVSDAPGLRSALATAARGPGMTIIECAVEAGCVDAHRALIAAMAQAAAAVLARGLP